MANIKDDKEIGFTIKKPKPEKIDKSQEVVTPIDDEGGITAASTGHYGLYVDIDSSIRTESELISRYRDISMYPEVDNAIEEITSEVIAAVDSEKPVSIDTSELEYSDKLKKIISDEFDEVLRLLDFKKRAHEIFKRWYVDGRVNYQKIIDKDNYSKGIKKLVYIDPRKIKKVRFVEKEKNEMGLEVVKSVEEYFAYNETGLNFNTQINSNPASRLQNNFIRFNTDAIAYCTSGIYDLDKNMVISYLHKAIKPVNNLKMMVDSLIIYRLSRAPERRIFYIDVGDLPKNKAEDYMKAVMNKYKNKIVYDAATGEIKDNKHFMTMMEDFWLPRRGDGKGTQIDTLRGAENLGNVQDVELLQNKMYMSLNVPPSRFQQQQNVLFGRQAEISREELKFAKFINRLRRRFNELFNDILKTNLILKKIIKIEDWDYLKDNIDYKYAQDQYFQEIKEGEILRNRLDLVNQIQAYVGTYFGPTYVKKEILKFTDDEIMEHQQDIEENMPESEGLDQDGKPVGSIQAGALTKAIDKGAPTPVDKE